MASHRLMPLLMILLCTAGSVSSGTTAGASGKDVSEPGVSRSAAITYLSQERSVYALASVDCMGYPLLEDEHEILSPNFAPFSATVDATAFDAGGYCDSHAEASQSSELHPDRLVGSGGAMATADNGSNGQYGIAIARGVSEFDVRFELSQSHAYTLSGSITRLSFFSMPSSVALLDGAGGYIHNVFFTLQDGGEVEFNEQGTLPPGEYRLVATSSVRSNPPNFPNDFGSYEFSLVIEQATPVEPSTWGRIKAHLR